MCTKDLEVGINGKSTFRCGPWLCMNVLPSVAKKTKLREKCIFDDITSEQGVENPEPLQHCCSNPRLPTQQLIVSVGHEKYACEGHTL